MIKAFKIGQLYQVVWNERLPEYVTLTAHGDIEVSPGTRDHSWLYLGLKKAVPNNSAFDTFMFLIEDKIHHIRPDWAKFFLMEMKS